MALLGRIRRKKLIKPGLQGRLVGVFLGLFALSLFLQATLFMVRLTELADSLPEDGDRVLALAPGMVGEIFLLSTLVLLPVIAAAGVLMTFRIAGPTYRFERFLEQVVRGEQIGPCKIREGDELQELCELINQATAPVRRRTAGPAPESSTDSSPERDETLAA